MPPRTTPPPPFEVSFDADRRLLHVVGRGVPSLADRVAWVNQVVNGHAPGAGIDVLIDVTDVTTMPEAEECGHIVRLMEKLQQHLGGRVAIVNARAGNATTTHLIAAYAASVDIRAFTDGNRARNWLLTGAE